MALLMSLACCHLGQQKIAANGMELVAATSLVMYLCSTFMVIIIITISELQQLQYLNFSRINFEGNSIPGFFGSLRNLRYLDLSICNLGGQIPIQLESLSHLKYLDLSNNHLDGVIPHRLGDLSNLQFLDLNTNDLDGSIPSQLGNLSNLQFLDLSHNIGLEGRIPSQLGKLTNLQELYLEGGYVFRFLTVDNDEPSGGQWLSNLNSLTHLHMSSISNLNKSNSWLQMVGKLPKLRELSLRDCGLSDHFIHSLSQSKFNFSTSLSILDLSDNNFASSLIFHWVSNISANLVELDLIGNQMVDLPSNSISCSLPKMRKLRLSYNKFISFMIFQWVSNMSSNLIELDLSNNLLEVLPSYGYGIVMKSLQVLDLSNNKLKGVAFKSFMNLCALRSLDIEENNFTEDLQLIFHYLSSTCVRNSLQVLDLRSNGITGTIPDLSIFTSLQTLDLSYNKLSGKIPEGSRLPFQLEYLSVQSNTLEGEIPKSFWMNACKLKSLKMSNNSFSGELQVLIHHLSRCARYSLQELYLSSNKINGTLPDLSIFSFLEIFHISENKINGVISDFHFAGMSMLKELDLSDNSLALTFTENWVPPFQLRGIGLRSCKLGLTFPKWIQTQKHIHNLDISNAGISDNIPEWFWAKLSSQECYRINISNNNLKGPIPAFLQGSELIDLSKNKFSDSRPFLCANGIDAMLGQVDLSNNQLSGQIPNCWSNFKSLAYVDLSHNNFSGKIPTSMGSLVKLQALLLTNNSLIGEIPFSLMNCTKLVMLDLRENRLQGLIPYWIGIELKRLQVLSLQKNNFFGSLPFEICYIQNIKLFDVSLNNLSGRIPECIKNFTSMTQKGSAQGFADQRYNITHGLITYFRAYKLNAFLTWKGVEQEFNNNGLSLLKSIDLSSNHFSEEIPPEIANLIQLVSLNLSRNNLTGKIPSNIGKLTSLDFLDFSRNNLLCSIPSSLSQIHRLGVLDLSHNQLSGEIPRSTQLQSFNASSYEDNLDLCGAPLVKLCVDGEPSQEPKGKIQDDEDLLRNRGFYISLTFGFILGFWGVFGSILIKRSWRHAYFKFMNNLWDNIYVKCRR
ncbi:receptor-like protein, putative [Medicago truncatula]|uniref:Receptor-like protein, putative n=1 Tax=Medicago truncatula TaxID=3880 RepID=A0A072U8A1_MEDTR|nr:receptor-like protein, putative [Medicago truncatula]